MADLTRTIQIIFDSIDNASGTIDEIGGSINDFSANVEGAVTPLADFTGSLLTAETTLLSIGAAMAGIAINQAGQFKTAVSEIGTLFEGTDQQVEGLSTQILEFSRNSAKSIDEINASVYTAISTGTDYADAVGVVTSAEALAVAGRANLSEVTTLLTSSLNAYGASAQDASDYSDVLFTTVQKGATSIPELASALAGVTGLASASKVPFDELNAALAAITVGGTGTSETVTQLQALFGELLAPTDELVEALGGVSLEADGLDGVMKRLKDVTGGSADEMVKLFGSSEAVLAALALSNDAAGAYAGALEAMEKRQGAVTKASEVMRKQFEAVNQTFANVIQATFIDAGLPLLDNYSDIVGALGDVFNALEFSAPDSAFKPLYDGIDAASATITKQLEGIAAALPKALESIDFTGLLDAFGNLGDSLGGLFGNLDLTKPEDLAVAIQALVDGVQALTTYTAGAVDGLQPFIAGVASLIDSINKGDQGIIEFVGNLGGVATAISALLPALSTAADLLVVFGGTGGLGAVASGAAKLLPLLANPATGLVAAIAAMGGATYRASEPVGDLISNMLGLESSAAQAAKQQADFAAQMDLVTAALNGNDKALANLDASWQGLVQARRDAEGIEDRLAQGVAFTNKSYEEQVAILSDAGEAQKIIDKINEDGAKAAQAAADERVNATKKMAVAWGEFTDAQKASLTESEKAEYQAAAERAERDGLLKVVEDTKKAVEDEEKALKAEQQARKEAADELFRHTQEANDFKLALEQIASDERLKALEFDFQLDLEKLKQDGETARTIIEGIGTTVQSTGETIVGLADSLSGLTGFAALEVRQELKKE